MAHSWPAFACSLSLFTEMVCCFLHATIFFAFSCQFFRKCIRFTLLLLVLVVSIWTLGEIVHSPVSAAYVANLSPAHLRGRYQGIWGLSWSAGLILGPTLGTLLFSWNATGLWLICGSLGLLAVLLVLLSGKAPASQLESPQ